MDIDGAWGRGFFVEYSVPAGDADGDGEVSLADFAVLKENFGRQNTQEESFVGFVDGDFDRNGVIDLTDFAILRDNFEAPAVAAPAPEPSTTFLLAVACCCSVRLRRSR